MIKLVQIGKDKIRVFLLIRDFILWIVFRVSIHAVKIFILVYLIASKIMDVW